MIKPTEMLDKAGSTEEEALEALKVMERIRQLKTDVAYLAFAFSGRLTAAQISRYMIAAQRLNEAELSLAGS